MNSPAPYSLFWKATLRQPPTSAKSFHWLDAVAVSLKVWTPCAARGGQQRVCIAG
jgi:hypothetical protein